MNPPSPNQPGQPTRINLAPLPPLPPPPAPKSRLPVIIARVVMFVVFAVSLWLIWWSVYQRLLPVLQQGRQKTSDVSALANEVQQLERQWDPVDAANTADRFKAAGNSLFVGQAECQAQEKELQDQALAMNFDVNIKPGVAQPDTRTKYKVSLELTIIDLEAAAEGAATDSPYQRLVDFTKLLLNQKTRMDLVELSASGNFNSVKQAKAVVQLWSQEGKLQ